MKTITIKQPWADLICSGVKDIENRTWPTKFRGRVLVHAASKSWNWYNLINYMTRMGSLGSFTAKWTRKWLSDLHTGAIIGSVEIVDCVVNHPSIWAEKCDPIFKYGTNKIVEATYNWVLANPVMFPEPIPAKGSLSFWDYPNILAETEEKDGELFCHCQLSVKEENQASGDSRFGYYCRYCGGKWYK